VYPLGYIYHHPVLDSQDENYLENSRKTPKGIDKIRIRFIIELWGKMGKKGR